MPDVTINVDTYWTPGASQGAGDGSTFDDRQAAPTDIDNLTINGVSVGTQATLYWVREANGHLKLASTAGGKSLFARGGIRTITDAALNDDPTVAFTLEIGGTVGGNLATNLNFNGVTALSKCFIGNDGASGLNTSTGINVNARPATFPDYSSVFSDCIIGNGNTNDINLSGAIHWRDVTLFTGGGVVLGQTRTNIFLSDVNTTGGTDYGSSGGIGIQVFKYGAIGPAGARIDNFGDSQMYLVRRATFTVEDGGSNPLPNIIVLATDGLGYISSKYITDASGKPQLQSRVSGNEVGLIYDPGIAYVPVWVDEYHRVGSSDRIQLESEAGGANRVDLSDASNKAQFVFIDPTGSLETQVIEDAMVGDNSQTVTMIGGSSPINLIIGVPTGRKGGEEVRINVTTDEIPIIAGTVLLIRTTDLDYAISAPIGFSGVNGVAIFRAGLIPAGTYEVWAFANTAINSGSAQGTDLEVGTSVSPLLDDYINRIVALFRANQPILDKLRDVGSKSEDEHPDIRRDSLFNLKRLAQSPGLVVTPGGLKDEGEDEEFLTTNAKVHTLRVTVSVTLRGAYEGMRNDEDFTRHNELRSAAMLALESDPQLGGLLKRSLVMSETETMEVETKSSRNATILISVFEVVGTVTRRTGARR